MLNVKTCQRGNQAQNYGQQRHDRGTVMSQKKVTRGNWGKNNQHLIITNNSTNSGGLPGTHDKWKPSLTSETQNNPKQRRNEAEKVPSFHSTVAHVVNVSQFLTCIIDVFTP